MKKRIISLILAVVMLALSLVGCAYSYEDDELSKYVETFDAEAFERAIKNLVFDDGDFTEDPEIRAQKVDDAIYALLATNASDKTNKTSGKPGAHDMLYYSYDILIEKEGEEPILLEPTAMNTEGKASLQLGMNSYSTTLNEEINKLVAEGNYEFSATKAYSKDSSTANKAEKGDLAVITYSYSYKEEGKDKPTTGTVSYQIVTLDENNPLHKKLIGYSLNTEYKETVTKEDNTTETKAEFVIPKDSGFIINGKPVNYEITISKAKVNYVIGGEQFAEIKEVTYEKEPATAFKDVYGNEHKVEGVTLTYRIYLDRYYKVDELNALNIIKLLYGSKLTKDILKNIVIAGADLASGALADEKAVEEQEKKQQEYLDAFTIEGFTADKDSTVFDTIADKIVNAFKECDTKKTSKNTASTALENAKDALLDAEKELEDNPTAKPLQEAVADAKAEVDAKQKAYDEAVAALNAAETERDEFVSMFLLRSKTAVDNAKKAHDDAVKAEGEAKAAYEEAKKNVDYANKESAYESAKKSESVKKTALENAEKDEAAKKTEAEKEGATEEAKQAYEDAKTATKTAKDAYDKAVAETKAAKELFDAAETATKTEKTAWEDAKKVTADALDKYKNPEKYLTPDSDAAKVYEEQNQIIVDGYKDVQYEALQNEYRADIKAKIVNAVFEVIKEHVVLKKAGGYPKKAVEEAYDILMNNYKYDFYNGSTKEKDDKGNTITNYTYYNGDFNDFLVASVTNDYAKVTNPDEAKTALMAWSQEKVAPVLQFSFIAEYYDEAWGGVVYTDKEFKAYKKDKNNGYESAEFYYGESTVRNGLQFEKLMDYFTKSTEKGDEDDIRFVKDEYTNVGIAK